MDYQFTYKENGEANVELGMGAEALEYWFNHELGRDNLKIKQLLDVINKLESKQIKSFQLKGHEYHLILNTEEVEVSAKWLANEIFDDLPEGTEVYDQESISGCGLEDFKQLLLSWSDFVSE